MTEDYFVRIDDAKSIELRRLQTAQHILLSSAAYITLNDVRLRKANYTAHLKDQMKSIEQLFHQLEKVLPHQELLSKRAPSQSPDASASAKVVHEPIAPISASSHKMDKLQEALSLIEKKIQSLDL